MSRLPKIIISGVSSLPLYLTIVLILSVSSSSVVSGCGYPGSPGHASVAFTSETIETGTIATYTCDNGYELLGPPRRTCAENGTWVPQGIPFCVLNVAVGKAAMQSSTVGQGAPQRAIDGSTSTFYNPNTCTMTEPDRNSWWYVNLLEPYLVQLVRIDFGTSSTNNRPATVTVRVGNNRPDLGVNAICNKFTGFIEEGRPLFLPCARPMPGAFVSVHLESGSNPPNPLSICEAFVYTDHALSIEQCPSFRDQPLGSTSTYNGKCYIFYNNQPMTFDNAKRFCDIRGGSLVDETSPALQGFLSWELYRRHRNDPNGQYWLGAVRDIRSPNNWKWINGKDVTISFWNQAGTGGNCSRFDGSKGWLWSDTSCKLNLNFVCQHRPLSCGKPERPANSTILARSVDIGSVIEYRCGAGNILVGPNVRTCLTNGFFSDFSPKCKYLECGFPASIANGQFNLVNGTRAFQSGVEYSCREGYVVVGRSYLTCDVDERWNGPPPRCEPILCPTPPTIENGLFALSNNSTVFGTRAFYSCLPGFEVIGSDSSIVCTTAGYWEGQTPMCRGKKRIPTSSSTTTTVTTTTSTTSPPPTRRITHHTQSTQVNNVNSFIPSSTHDPSTPPFVSLTPVVTPSSTLRPGIFTTRLTTSTLPQDNQNNPLINLNNNNNGNNSNNKRINGGSTTSSSSTRKPQTIGSTTKKTYNRPFDNEIADSSSVRSGSKTASGRLNMGGIIALGVFGGFVFLAAVITIIVIIVRRLKNSRNSIDAQTISTFDSSGDQSGFYRNYQQAWENLRFAGHSASPSSYKGGVVTTNGVSDSSNFNHHTSRGAGSRGTGGGYNEGFRDTNEITLNADVAALYSRPEGHRSSNTNGNGVAGINGGRGQKNSRRDRDSNDSSDSPWRRKY